MTEGMFNIITGWRAKCSWYTWTCIRLHGNWLLSSICLRFLSTKITNRNRFFCGILPLCGWPRKYAWIYINPFSANAVIESASQCAAFLTKPSTTSAVDSAVWLIYSANNGTSGQKGIGVRGHNTSSFAFDDMFEWFTDWSVMALDHFSYEFVHCRFAWYTIVITWTYRAPVLNFSAMMSSRKTSAAGMLQPRPTWYNAWCSKNINSRFIKWWLSLVDVQHCWAPHYLSSTNVDVCNWSNFQLLAVVRSDKSTFFIRCKAGSKLETNFDAGTSHFKEIKV